MVKKQKKTVLVAFSDKKISCKKKSKIQVKVSCLGMSTFLQFNCPEGSRDKTNESALAQMVREVFYTFATFVFFFS